ncbi:uncharacterized protein K460DRAFT_401428 [Cucurbitaria berberidis CBS 394.84]|uniref:N-acetyltransferase domain-containing protein n=1 Tax=Cucurbitaria berberidis CBS 394.84 TaxID=1168544 RepID=A0A9P4LEI4_9PLEO|nr:uncharacterized protein K460DRAFT_401428 [Cucurbitaria berberidis CBS 394.84]KAF1851407.1 hypothetical protein K460DRAFT_401428 [Cucurbitaria berberidis CBS 394.84]
MNSIFETPRLLLIRLTDTSEGSQHVQWFHENWSNDEATAWSLHGKCHTLAESREWMLEHKTKYNNIFYSCFAKTPTSKGTEADPGDHVGSISLRQQHSGPAMLPPPIPGQESSSTYKPINLRVIGYAFFKQHWGKGYATEAGKGLLAEYARSVAEEKEKGEELFYVEGGADQDNPGSKHVLEKIGFKEVGWKEEKEPVFLNGKWRDPGYWIYGQYV